MRRGWITCAGFAPLGLAILWAVLGGHALAAQSTSGAQTVPPKKPVRARSKKKPRTPVKRAVVRRPVVKRKPAPKIAVAPKRPPADIPVVTEAASVRRGCMESRDLPMLASNLAMDETRLKSLLTGEGLLASESAPCVPFVAAMGGEDGAASVIFRLAEPNSSEVPTLVVRKTADGASATTGICYCLEPARRVLAVPARAMADPNNEIIASIPANVRWQLDTLVPQMIRRLPSEKTVTEEFAAAPVDGQSTTDAYTVRIVVERHADTEPEYLRSVEIVESAPDRAERLVDGAWWLERQDGPGVFIGMEGLSYERLIWQSPVAYLRKSRGVGPAVSTYRRKVTTTAADGTKKTVVRTVQVQRDHLGVDMMAPKGLEVHSVGGGKVAFAGRKNGFGNVIILDHGRGYQTYYAHLSKITRGVKAGAPVSRGDVIGLVGSTGHSTAPHLHFETRKDSRYIDPFDESKQLEFWLLTADDQERLAMQLLTSTSALSAEVHSR
jgi:murein DD-endopeptidase MepM/ murein hydrolase activator NlpD